MEKNKAISGYEKTFDDGYRAGRASVVLPRPCDGPLYKSWMAKDYFLKISEEFLEVVEAYHEVMAAKNDENRKEAERHLMRECTDLKVIVTSFMQYFGCGEEERQQYMKEINESNAKRDGGKRFSWSVDQNAEHIKKRINGSLEIGENVRIHIPESELALGLLFASKENAERLLFCLRFNDSVGTIVDYGELKDGYVVKVDDTCCEMSGAWLKRLEE